MVISVSPRIQGALVEVVYYPTFPIPTDWMIVHYWPANLNITVRLPPQACPFCMLVLISLPEKGSQMQDIGRIHKEFSSLCALYCCVVCRYCLGPFKEEIYSHCLVHPLESMTGK